MRFIVIIKFAHDSKMPIKIGFRNKKSAMECADCWPHTNEVSGIKVFDGEKNVFVHVWTNPAFIVV